MVARVHPDYVRSVASRGAFGCGGYWGHDRLLERQVPHPGRPPYVRRGRGPNPDVPTPGRRPMWWLSFQPVPLTTGDRMVIVSQDESIIWAIEWQVDGDLPVHPVGPIPDPNRWLDVPILSTDTPAEIAASTADLLLNTYPLPPQYWTTQLIQVVTVVAGDRWSVSGLPEGPALVIEWEGLYPIDEARDHSIPSGGVYFDGTPAPGSRPVEYFPLGSDPEGGAGMISRGQEPVYALPARFGFNRAVLPIGDELPTSTWDELYYGDH